MSATAQQSRTETINGTGSLTMMKNIVRTGISEVCYLRGIFDESSFQSKAIHGKGGDKKDGVTVHVLKTKDQDNDEAQLVMDWLQHGVYEAMDKGYLRAITVGSRGDCARFSQFVLTRPSCASTTA